MKFKTNINCAGCVAKVTPILNQTVGENGWQVDTTQPDKPLTITNESVNATTVMEAIKKTGFTIEAV